MYIYIYVNIYTIYKYVYFLSTSAAYVSFQLLLSSGITKLRCSAGAMACITRFKEPSSSMGLLKVMSGLSLEPPVGENKKRRKFCVSRAENDGKGVHFFLNKRF